MPSLAFKFEEITTRELKPELYELNSMSRATIEAHYKLFQGYVNKPNEILARLNGVDTSSANQSIRGCQSTEGRPSVRDEQDRGPADASSSASAAAEGDPDRVDRRS